MKTTYSIVLFFNKKNGRVVQHQKVYNAQRSSILVGNKIWLQIFKGKKKKRKIPVQNLVPFFYATRWSKYLKAYTALEVPFEFLAANERIKSILYYRLHSIL